MSSVTSHPPKVSILLIRESPEQMSGSGCCGKLEGDQSITGGTAAFRDIRQTQKEFGVLHRTVVEFYGPALQSGDLTITTIDPRNQLYLIPKLCSDVWRYRPCWKKALSSLLQMFSLPAVVLNGRVISQRGKTMDPDTICHEISRIVKSESSRTGIKPV